MNNEPTTQYEELETEIGANIFQMYEGLYRDMVSLLEVAHLNPICNVLSKRKEGNLKYSEKLIKDVQSKMLNELLESHNNLWENPDIQAFLVLLNAYQYQCMQSANMLDLNIKRRSPKEQTRATRMRLKYKVQKYLDAYTKHQKIEIQDIFITNITYRNILETILKDRVMLSNAVKKYTSQLETHKSAVLLMGTNLLQSDEQDE